MEQELNNENFEQEVIKSDKPVLIDFYADWCGPCKISSPFVDEFAKQYEGVIKVFKVNVEKYPDIAVKYSVMNVPTFVYIKDGVLQDKIVGAVNLDGLIKLTKMN